MIEVEKRGLLSEAEHASLLALLKDGAVYLGEDNKYVEYWIYPDKLLKLIRSHSRKEAVLSLKLNPIGSGNLYEEYEVVLREDQFETLAKIVGHLTKPDQIIKGTQKRENYAYKDVEIAIKWSEDWNYHVELECLVENSSQQGLAIERIDRVAQDFGIKLMTIEEERTFIQEVRKRRK